MIDRDPSEDLARPHRSRDRGQLVRLARLHRIFGWLVMVLGAPLCAYGVVLAPGLLALNAGLVLLVWFLATFVLLAWAWLSFAMAHWLEERHDRSWLVTASCLNLLAIPVGTALGAYTLSVLRRASVQEAFRPQDQRVR